MLITGITIILFYAVALLSVALGHWLKRIEIYSFGVLLVFLVSGFVWYNGISEQTGETSQVVLGVTTTTFTFDQNRPLWIDFLSVGGILLGTWLALTTYREYEAETQRSRETDIDAR